MQQQQQQPKHTISTSVQFDEYSRMQVMYSQYAIESLFPLYIYLSYLPYNLCSALLDSQVILANTC